MKRTMRTTTTKSYLMKDPLRLLVLSFSLGLLTACCTVGAFSNPPTFHQCARFAATKPTSSAPCLRARDGRGGSSGGAPQTFSGGSGPPRGNGGLGGWDWGGGGGGGEGGGGDSAEDGRLALVGKNELGALGYAQALMMSRDRRYRTRQYGSPYGGSGGYRQTSRRTRRQTDLGISATKVLIVINVLMYGVQTLYPSVTRAGWKMASAIANQGQWYRLLTPVVLHGSVPHLAVNSLSLNSVGPVVESMLGKPKFLAVYAAAGISGNVLSCIINPRMPAVGASGAIFGIVGAFAAFCLMNRSVLGKENSRRALTGVGQTLAMNLALGLSSTHIDNMGHVGGFIGGFVSTCIIGPRLRRRRNSITGELYTVDVSPKFALPRFRKRAEPAGERRWP